MKIDPFLLERWLQAHSGPSIRFDFGGSTGPRWALREVLELDGPDAAGRLLDVPLAYSKTAGAVPLRAAIADMAGVPPEHVVVLAGASEALTYIFSLAAEPGANVVVPFPCYPPHETLPRAFGLETRRYHLRRERGFRVDIDEVAALIDRRTRVLLVNVPYNPTGAALTDAELAALHDLAAGRGVQFVCDEVHSPVFHGRQTASAARLPHATTVGDFSKAFSLPGLRLGWVIEPDPARRAAYLNSREYVTVCNPPLTEFVAEVAVRHRAAIHGRARDVARRNLDALDRLLARFADAVGWVRPEGGMTGFPWLRGGGSSRGLCEAAADRGILLVPGDCLGAPDHFRIGFGSQADGFGEALEALGAFLEGWHPGQRDRAGG